MRLPTSSVCHCRVDYRALFTSSRLGVRVELKSGALVRKESIVGALAFVERQISAWVIAIGRSAKIIRFRNI